MRAMKSELRRPDGQPVRVLVVDDESTLAELMTMALRMETWDVRTALDGQTAVRTAREFRPDAVVLDVMLPDFNGFEVLRRMRADFPALPVLFLTAKDAVEDRIAGLTAGGDDYVTKPFSLEEVVLRLRALLRRTGVTDADAGTRLIVGDLSLNEETREVERGGTSIELTATEFELLRYLRLRRPGQHRRALHLLPAQEDRRRTCSDDPHDARRGLCPQACDLEPSARSWSSARSSSPSRCASSWAAWRSWHCASS
jgi:two-component system, OmpR family, response regulator